MIRKRRRKQNARLPGNPPDDALPVGQELPKLQEGNPPEPHPAAAPHAPLHADLRKSEARAGLAHRRVLNAVQLNADQHLAAPLVLPLNVLVRRNPNGRPPGAPLVLFAVLKLLSDGLAEEGPLRNALLRLP